MSSNEKFIAKIRHPINKKIIWMKSLLVLMKLNFLQGEEAWMYNASSLAQAESMVVAENNNHVNNDKNEGIFRGTWVITSMDSEVKYSYKLGVPIVQNNGFLLGEFRGLDDLT